MSRGLPAYAGGLLFSLGDHSLLVRRLLDAGSETIKEIAGNFSTFNPYFSHPIGKQVDEIYTERDNRIVRIDLSTLNVEDVGPDRGHIWRVPPGVFYYVEFETWPARNTDKWKKLYRLQDGRMVFLKQLDFGDDGYGLVELSSNGVVLHQKKIVGNKGKTTVRVFAFPDLKELKFKELN